MEIPTEKGFNLQSTDYAMPEKVFPIFNDFVLNSFGLLKGHCLEAIVSILSWYVETMMCYCIVYRVILKSINYFYE